MVKKSNGCFETSKNEEKEKVKKSNGCLKLLKMKKKKRLRERMVVLNL